jgi:hypothetical protein
MIIGIFADASVETEPLSKEEPNKRNLETCLRHVRSQQYDVFLSYAEEDWEFAEEMRSRLVREVKLRVFVPSDGEYFNNGFAIYKTQRELWAIYAYLLETFAGGYSDYISDTINRAHPRRGVS